eukprot:6814718-Ditylum_brightwellii.AAC.1
MQFNKLFKCLAENEEAAVVPIDKTNSYKVVLLEDYKKRVLQHLKENAAEIHRSNVVKIHEEAEQYADSLAGILSPSEFGVLREGIASRAIPQPQLLIKDHKDQEPNGDYLTRLVIPATNFMATFSKVGYMAIQKVLDCNKVNYNRFTIVHSSGLKENLEGLKLTKNDVTLMSLDIKNMYPSIRVKLIKKVLKFYSRSLSPEDKQKLELGMEMIQFGMKNML